MSSSGGARASAVAIDVGACVDCGRCITICPTDVFRKDEVSGKAFVAFAEDCHVCFLCVEDCEPKAISLDHSVGNRRHRSVYADLGPEDLVLTPEAGVKTY